MSTVPPEIGVRLLQELTSDDEKYAINGQQNLSYSIVWCLVRLLETDDEEKIEEGIRIALKFFHSSPRIFQANFLNKVHVASRFNLTVLLCSHAIRLGVPFPSHLLVESTFRISYKSVISQHMMGTGSNSAYNLGISSNGEVTESRLIPLNQKIRKISMSTHHSLFLTEDGSFYGCGKGNLGQLGVKLKCLVVEPTLIFQATESLSVLDILAGEGFSVFLTSDNKINMLGRYGKTGTESGEPLKVQCEKKPFLGIVYENESIKVSLRDWTYTCTLKEEGFSEQIEYYHFDPSAGFQTTTLQEVELKPLYGSGTSHHVTLKHIIKRIEVGTEKDIPFGTILAVVRSQPQQTMVIYSVNGLMLDLNVSQIQITKNGKTVLVASTFSMDKKDNRPRSSCLYTGRAVLINEDADAGYKVVRDVKHVSNYRVLIELEEFPCSHSVRHFGLSPDGANMIYLVDRDQDQTYLEEKKYHVLGEVPKEKRGRFAGRTSTLQVPKNRKAVTNLEELNQRREEVGMEPIELDAFIPDKLTFHFLMNPHKNRRLDFIRSIYPAVDEYITEEKLEFPSFQSSQKPRYIDNQHYRDLLNFLALTFLNGTDILPVEAISCAYGLMVETGKKDKMEKVTDPSEKKRLFHEFLEESLAEIDLKAVELLPGKYLLRSLAAENWTSQIAGDVTVKTSDGEFIPFIWDALFFQSEYFPAVMCHGSGDNSIKIDFPMEIVSSALRVFLEPNHLYDLSFEKLFVLIDLYDKYLCYAAIEDTLDVMFETVTEANIHLVYDLYERMDHLKPYLEQQFQQRTHIMLYWKSARIPFGLLKELNKKIRADEVPEVKKRDIMGRFHELMMGDDFTRAWETPLLDAHGMIHPFNWARIRKTEVEQYMYGHWWTKNAKQTAIQTFFDQQYTLAARFLGEEEYITFVNGNMDRFKFVPPSLQRLLDDKKWTKDGQNVKKTGRVRTTSSMSEQVASSPRSKGLSPTAPSTSSVFLEQPVEIPGVNLCLQEAEIPKEEVTTPVSLSSETSNEQNVDPEFPGVSLKEAPKTPKEKLIFPKKGHGVKIDPFSPKTPSPAPWAGSSPSTSGTRNFKEIQEEEAERERTTPKRARPVPIVTRRERKSTWNEEVSGSVSSPPVSLAAIMADEERRLRPQVKPAKPLEAVAMEEQAIQELFRQYAAEFDGQAVISVTFASTASY